MAQPDTTSIAARGMLQLPDEILLNITMRLCGASSDPHRLLRVHRRFRFVVQESLLCKGRIRTRDIPVYIQLLSQHPRLIPQVEHIELIEGRKRRNCATPDHAAAQQACRSFLDALPLDMAATQYRANLGFTNWASSEFWVIALLAIMSHTKTLTIRSNDALVAIKNSALLGRNGGCDGCLKGKLSSIFLGRLEAISLPTPNTNPLNLPNLGCFQALKVLTISGSILSRMTSALVDELISRRLDVLQILSDKKTIPWNFLISLERTLSIVHWYRRPLGSVRLLINEPCQFFVDSIKNRSIFSEISRTLRNWQRNSVDLQIMFKEVNSDSPDLDLAHYKPANNFLQDIKAAEAEMWREAFRQHVIAKTQCLGG